MQFMFKCRQHEVNLVGEPELMHPQPEAELVWTFNTHNLKCPVGHHEPTKNGCRSNWKVYAVLGPQTL